MLRSGLFLFGLLVSTALSAQTYSILTWNIRYDNAGDSLDRWDRRKVSLAAEVLSRKPQLIGLQEALSHQVDFLDEHFKGYGRYGVGRDDGQSKGEFSPVYFDTAVVSLVEGRTIWLSPKPDVPSKGWDAACERIATQVILFDKKNGDTLWVVNTHWDHVGERARKQSGEMIRELLASPIARDKHVLLMGDFNATADEEPIATLRLWLEDSCPTDRAGDGTFNAFRTDLTSFKRIDYIWHSPKNWEVLNHNVPHPMVSGRQMSDHFPVVVRLRWK